MRRSLTPAIMKILETGRYTTEEVTRLMEKEKPNSVRCALFNMYSRGKISRYKCEETGRTLFTVKAAKGKSIIHEIDELLAPVRARRIA